MDDAIVDRFQQRGEFAADHLVELVERIVHPPEHDKVDIVADVGYPDQILRPALVDVKQGDLLFRLVQDSMAELGPQAIIALRCPVGEEREGRLVQEDRLASLVNARTGQPITLRDPLNVGIVNNVIPKSALSPQIQTFLKFVPLRLRFPPNVLESI